MSDTQGAAATGHLPPIPAKDRARRFAVRRRTGPRPLADAHKIPCRGDEFRPPEERCDPRLQLGGFNAGYDPKKNPAVMLQAGYENGAYGIIFSGTILRIRTGRESATDTFLEIMAADGDIAFNKPSSTRPSRQARRRFRRRKLSLTR